MPLRVLVTGFRPWNQVHYNPTNVVVERLRGQTLNGQDHGAPHAGRVHGLVLDVAWGPGTDGRGQSVRAAAAALALEVAEIEPQIIVSFGVIPDEPDAFDVETVAEDDVGGVDVRGVERPRAPRYPGEPRRATLTLPAQRIVTAMRHDGLQAKSDPGLGNYLCETIAYEGARLTRQSRGATLASGFIHVPNPLFKAAGRYDIDPTTLDAAQRLVFEAAEAAVVRGARIAVEVALGSLPP